VIGIAVGYHIITKTSIPVGCSEDAKICPDGSIVVRISPDCEFAECPSGL